MELRPHLTQMIIIAKPINSKNMRKNGYTLIELMIVIIIIGIVFGSIISVANGINRRGRDGQRQNDLSNIQNAIQKYYADNHFYPDPALINPLLAGGGSFTDSGRTYLSQVPVDPSGTTNYCYNAQVAASVPTCSNAVNSTNKCQYYQLCANLEDPVSTATPCTCGGIPYNYSVHSP